MSERRTTIYAAVAANALIAITKFIAAAATGSGAMLSEGLHSVVDTGDGLMILLGLHLSRKAPSREHPYGHGLEVYFWSMIVAMTIFGAGGGVSLYEGIHHLMAPRAIEFTPWTYVVLGVAFAFEGVSWLVSLRGFRRMRGSRGSWDAIERSKDPTTFVVVLEDSAALLGIVAAAVGITLAHLLDNPAFDAAASIVIGGLLITVAVVLGRETWSLLVGESAAPELVRSIREIAVARPGVLDAREPRTMHLGPDTVHVDLDLQVDPGTTGGDVMTLSREIEAAVRERHPQIRRVSLRFPEWSPA